MGTIKLRKEYNMEKRKSFERPTQVKFCEIGAEESIEYGIAYNDEVICACCGGIFELDEVEILEEYEDWIDFKYEIGD